MPEKQCPVVVLISGSGSNLQAIIDAQAANYPARVKAVISNKPGIKGLQRAQQANIPTQVISHEGFASREAYDRELSHAIDSYSPELIVLAGFMRILSDWFVKKYAGRLLNIHPSLLPKYKGLHTHEQALEAKDSFHGATVHFVTAELDGGPLILQARVAISADDTPSALAGRVLAKEHEIYPRVIAWAAQGRLKMQDGFAMLDGKILHEPLLLENL